MIQKYSFKDFLTKEVELISNGEVQSVTTINRIEIPMIQRDYAQGRALFSNKEKQTQLNHTGEKFIKELFAFLIEPTIESQMELDFVYGSIKEIDGINYFYPLDGQQRLTTLFLLYWYIGGAELDENGKKELAKILGNFYYATRASSNIFCKNIVNELCSENIDFHLKKGALMKNDAEIEPARDLISQIENLSWFHDSYKLDPTVLAMLNMLDRIQELYIEYHNENMFENLEKLRFYILPLSNFDLSEDLYVKMNARGKQLTGFENFKADFQNWIQKESKTLGFNDQTYDGRTMPYDMYIINKMDNEWAQCFWNLKKNSEDKSFDLFFMNFIYRYWLNEYILKATVSNKALDKETDFILLRDEPEYFGFSLFERNIDKDLVINFQILLDKISQHYDEIIEIIQPSWATKEEEKFHLLTESFGLKQRAAFSAMVMYLVKKKYCKFTFEKWMHVVWNIIENANIDSVRVLASVMQLLSELSQYSDDIYSMLADDTIVIKSIQSSVTIQEERWKARLILENSEWEDVLLEAESHPYFRGSISFLISDDEDIDQFKHNYQMAKIFFDNNGISEKYRADGHIFLRALISRYSSLSEIKYHITDKSEKENSLKNMLSSDDVVRIAIREWFALENEEAIAKKLLEEVQKDSPVAVEENDFEKKLHESLYKRTELIDWMQERGAIRYKDKYISKPNSWYDWIYVYGYRNELIHELTKDGWECENRCYIGEEETKKVIPYFWSGDKEITLKKSVKDVLLKCDIDREEIWIYIDEKKDPENYLQTITSAAQLPIFMRCINSKVGELLSDI